MGQRSWYNMPRAFKPDGKRCKKSLGLELSHRASSLYAYGKIKLWIEMRLRKLPLEVCFLLRGRVPVKRGG